MSRIAFHAPLKPPDHPVPSGERTMARALIAALAANPAGWPVDVASTLRTREGAGDPAAQDALFAAARAEVARLTADPPPWAVWVTYHNYWKAPDLIGPAVARALRIPYIQIESTRARSRLTGPWARFAAAAEAASDAAAVILHLTARDAEALARDRPPGQRLMPLAPFLNADRLPDPVTRTPGRRILAVGMMRAGDKLASYAALAAALAHVPPPFTVTAAGDGPAREAVAALLAPYRAALPGALGPEALAAAYRAHDLLIWPGVNEAFGMVYLEAQAHGLPVLAERRPGVDEVVGQGGVLTPPGDARAMAAAASGLLADPAARAALGAAGRAGVAARHLRPAATATLWAAIRAALNR
jgi:glycosyltransferase involved in cell wall biosynthesis